MNYLHLFHYLYTVGRINFLEWSLRFFLRVLEFTKSPNIAKTRTRNLATLY